jgi:hypothetical protein
MKRTENNYLQEYEVIREPISFSLNQASKMDEKILERPEKVISLKTPKLSEQNFLPIPNLSIYMQIGDLAPPVRTLYQEFKVSPLICNPAEVLRAVKEKRC